MLYDLTYEVIEQYREQRAGEIERQVAEVEERARFAE